MELERKPAAFGDMRRWLDALRAERELHEVKAEVDWNTELGTIVRWRRGGTGCAALPVTSNYNRPGSRGRRSSPAACRTIAVAMVFSLHPDTHPVVKLARNIMAGTLPPKKSIRVR